jgi:hypothetical protein
MRTRRSWRNQNILFRELFAPPQPPKPPLTRQIEIIELAIARCRNQRTRRQLERDLKSMKRKRAMNRRSMVASSQKTVTLSQDGKPAQVVSPDHQSDDAGLVSAKAALRLCLAEIEQFHRTAYPDCTGGCPAHEAMDTARRVLS